MPASSRAKTEVLSAWTSGFERDLWASPYLFEGSPPAVMFAEGRSAAVGLGSAFVEGHEPLASKSDTSNLVGKFGTYSPIPDHCKGPCSANQIFDLRRACYEDFQSCGILSCALQWENDECVAVGECSPFQCPGRPPEDQTPWY